MKKILAGALLGIFLLTGNVYAAGITGNASPITTGVNSNVLYANFTFSPQTRNLTIQNNDSTAYVWVDVKSGSNTVTKNNCFLLGPGNSIDLYDFLTDGISIIYDNGEYSTDTEASPITVIATY